MEFLLAGIEDALAQVTKGEKALFIIPASALQPPAASTVWPSIPKKAVQVEAVIELLSLVQVCVCVCVTVHRHVSACAGMGGGDVGNMVCVYVKELRRAVHMFRGCA